MHGIFTFAIQKNAGSYEISVAKSSYGPKNTKNRCLLVLLRICTSTLRCVEEKHERLKRYKNSLY